MFLIASDDLNWCSENLAKDHADAIVVDSASPEDDIALLSSLDHFIYSQGTYGIWISLLLEGDIIAYPGNFTGKRYAHHASFDLLNQNKFIKIYF